MFYLLFFAFVFWLFSIVWTCILSLLNFVDITLCHIYILTHLHFGTFAFCRFYILSLLYFVAFAFCRICILALHFVSFALCPSCISSWNPGLASLGYPTKCSSSSYGANISINPGESYSTQRVCSPSVPSACSAALLLWTSWDCVRVRAHIEFRLNKLSYGLWMNQATLVFI